MKKYSINLRSVLFALQDFFMFTALNMVLLLVILYYLGTQEKEFINFLFLIFFSYYSIVALIPVLFLFFNYEQNDAGNKINSEEIKAVEIQEIIIYGAHQHFHRGYGLLPHAQDFFYMEIKLFDNRKYYITCLMSPEIDKEFKRELPYVKFIDRIKVFPKI